MAKEGGKLLIKYRDPVAASFSSKDIVLNVQTGTLFYKRNRKLFGLRGTPDNFDLVVFPGQSTNQQILINDSSQEDGSPIMEGTDQFRFKLASATCGCANYFHIGTETLTHFSGSVRIGEHLPSTCDLLDGEVNPSLLVHGNMEVSASAGGIGNISASGNIEASIDLYGTNAYIHDSLIHRGNTTTKLNFGTDTINLYSDGSSIATVSSDRFTVNGSNDLFIPGTNSAPSSGTSVLVINNADGRVYKTGSFFAAETFKATGTRTGFAYIDGNVTASGNISASGLLYVSSSVGNYANVIVHDTSSGRLYTTSSADLFVTNTFKASGQRTGDSSIDGNLTVTGNITAQEFHTEFVSSSIIFTSGSTQFGNSSDDTHTFSGSIYVKDEGHITASGNISASGLLYSSASLGFDNISIYNSSSGQYFYTSSQGLSNQLDTFKQTGLRTGDGYITGNITGGVNIQVNGGDPENYLAGALNIGLTGRPSSLGDDVSYFKGSLIVGRHQGGINPDNRILQGTAASLIVGQGNIVTNQFANSIVMGIFNSGSGLANFVGGSNHNKGLSDATMVFGYGNHNEDNDGGIVLGAYNHISATTSNGHHAIGNYLVNSGSLVGSIVLGMYNTHGVTDAIFTIGQGTDSLRKDLLVARSGSIEIIGHITASENISASGEVIAASANITNITASGNISASGTVYADNFRTSTEFSEILTGYITASHGSNQISGSGTLFENELNVGDAIKIVSSSGTSQIFTISEISSSTSMSIDSNWSGTSWNTGSAYIDSDLFTIKDGDNNKKVYFTNSGDISASGKLYGGLSNTNNANLVFYNPTGGELTYAASSSFLAGLLSSSAQIATNISGAIDAATGSLLNTYTFLSSSTQISSDISGSWQGQNFISASQTFLSTGQRSGDSAITGSLDITNHITASGNISSSGYVRALKGQFGDSPVAAGPIRDLEVRNSDTVRLRLESTGNNNQLIEFMNNQEPDFIIGNFFGDAGFQIKSDDKIFLQIGANDGDEIKASGSLNVTSDITASGNISASGLLYASASSANGNLYHTVMINTASGEFFYTGSYGGGGGTSDFTAAGISGSWQGQNFISASQLPLGLISSSTQIDNLFNIDGLVSSSQQIEDFDNFLLNTTDTLTGDLTVTKTGSFGQVEIGSPHENDSKLSIEISDTTTNDPTNTYSNYCLSLRNYTNGLNRFAGIAFDLSSEIDADSIGAAIKGVCANASSVSHRTHLTFHTNPLGDDAILERMRITADGEVGIGDTSPNQLLGIKGTNAQISIEEDDNEFIRIGVGETESTAVIGWDDGTDLLLGVYNSPTDTSINTKATIKLDGKVGIGTTDPTEVLQVEGYVSASGFKTPGSGILRSDGTTSNTYIGSTSTGNNISITSTSNSTVGGTNAQIKFNPGGDQHGIYFNSAADTMGTPTSVFKYDGTDLSVGGDIIAFASDKRLKENIVVISDPIEKIKQLRGVTYDWRDSTLDLGFKTKRQYNEIGLIAQELEKVIPQAVTRAPFDHTNNPKIYVSGSRIDGETDPYKTIKMDKVVPLLIEGIKDQQKQIDELKELVTKLINK